MTRWWFNPAYAGTPAETAFAGLDSVFALSGEEVSRAPLSHVLRINVGDRRFYVKRYQGNGKSALHNWFGLRGLFAPLRVQTEWENLRRFQDWHIPTAPLVACGLERRWGYFLRGALITEEIAGTTDLAHLARTGDARLADRRWVAVVSRQVAQATRRMHAAGFAHNDLKWRNLLVDAEATVHFIDCPTGGHWWGSFLRYRMVKDLACLDKVAQYHLSRTQRLRFYLDYANRPRLTPADKRRIRKITSFFRGRE